MPAEQDGGRRALPRWLVVVLGLAATTIALAGMRAASSLLSPVLLALVLVVVVHPLLTGLQARGWPRWLAIGVSAVAVDGSLLLLAGALAVSFGQLATVLPGYSAQWNHLLDQLTARLTAMGIGSEQITSALHNVSPSSVVGLVGGVVSGLLSAVTTFVLVLATVAFMCADAASLPARLGRGTGTSPSLARALESFARRTRSYIVVSTAFGLIVAALDTIALAALGIPLALLWGLVSFITNYVPNIGFVLGLLPPALLGLLVGGWQSLVLVVVVYCAINFVIQSVIQPAVVGDAVGLSVTVTFVSLILWALVLGAMGALLAVPLTLLVHALVLEADPDAQWAAALVSHGPPAEGRRRMPRFPRRRQPAPAHPRGMRDGTAQEPIVATTAATAPAEPPAPSPEENPPCD